MLQLIELVLLIASLIALIPILGNYLTAVFTRQALPVDGIFGRLEKLCYRLSNIDPIEEMPWSTYGKNLLFFNIWGFITVFLLQELQGFLPLNPENFAAVPWDSAFNTAVSFTTNTNWQSFPPETSLGYLTQTFGLAVQNFLSAATGMTILIALIRGITEKSALTIGNFWSDLVRTVTYILLPLSIILALILVSQGVIQNYSPYIQATTLETGTQTLPMGPAASQVAIKQLGSNGGGFFNANSAHPFENPTGISNFLQTLAILLIPTASVYMYGNMIGSKKHAWMILFVMFFLWGLGLTVSHIAEFTYDPVVGSYPLMEGIETRFGIPRSISWSTATTATSNGSVNATLSSLSPLAGGVALFNIMLGEIIFGGVGVGLCGMIMFIILTVFLSGLMVGRTPEYLGKKIEKQEMAWVVCAILLPCSMILIGAGITSILPTTLSGILNSGPHGLSEILYAFSSAAGNNGSAFAGLNANSPYYNITLGIVMLVGRAAIILPSLAIAGLLAKKKITPPSLGTLSTSSITFAILLLGVIFIVGALTFFPAMALGPIMEHLLLLQNRAF